MARNLVQAFDLAKTAARALDDLPLINRLEFAKNIVCDRGGDRNGIGEQTDPALILAHDVISDAIEMLKTYPAAAGLRRPAEPADAAILAWVPGP